jgi:hypothetical protein
LGSRASMSSFVEVDTVGHRSEVREIVVVDCFRWAAASVAREGRWSDRWPLESLDAGELSQPSVSRSFPGRNP